MGNATPALRRAAFMRVIALAITLAAFAAFFGLSGTIGKETIREWIEPAGVFRAPLFVLIAGVLVAALAPAALMAATAGLLFGPLPGAALSLCAALLSSALSHKFSTRVAGDSLHESGGPKIQALTRFARRRGLLAVIAQRLLPLTPDGPASHAFALAGVKRRDLVLGTLIASGPRAFSYALIGSGAGDLTGKETVAGVALNIATGVAGLLMVALIVRREAKLAREAKSSVQVTTSAATAAHGG